MAANDGDHPVSEIFPGIAVPAGTGAPGSPGASEPGPMADNAYSTAATSVYESVQNRPASAYTVGVGTDDVNMPGQSREGLSGQTITNTGAGQGSNVMQGHHPNAGGGQL